MSNSCSSTSLASRLKEREEVRYKAVEKRKATRKGEQRLEETSEHFTSLVEAKKNGMSLTFYGVSECQMEINVFVLLSLAISCSLELAESLAKDELPAHFENVFSQCSDIQKLISDSSLFLSSYNVRIAQKVGKKIIVMYPYTSTLFRNMSWL